MSKEHQQQAYANEISTRVLEACSKLVVGKKPAIELLLTTVLAGGHALLEGPPGVAKTHIANTFARTLGCAFRRIQFTPDLLPSDILGSYIYDQKAGDFRLWKGPIFSNVVLIDEINRGMPKTQSATLEVMQEHQVTIEGNTLPVDEPFIILATKNPLELEGVYPLSEAQIDRFMFKVEITYPTPEEEHLLLDSLHAIETGTIEPVLTREDISRLKALVASVHVAPAVREYMVNLIQMTRKHPKFMLGGSPRALVHLFKSSQAFALVRGRNYVIPDDVKQLIQPLLNHRVILSREAEAEDFKPEEILAEILDKTPIPHSDSPATH